MNDELERIWKASAVANLRYYPGICLEGLRKTTKNVSQSPGLDFNTRPTDDEAEVLTNQPRRSV
jgi:hypothetical protein